MKIKHLIFDLGGVIVLNNRLDYTIFDKRYGLPDGSVKNIVSDCYSQLIAGDKIDLKKYIEEKYSGIITHQQYQHIINSIYATEKLNTKLINWIKAHKDHFSINILSNNTTALKKLLQNKFPIADLFNFVFNSADIRLAKPDPELFEYVTKKLQTTPQECIFIDDNPNHISAASELGFNTLHFVNNQAFFKDFGKLTAKLSKS